MCSEFMPRPRSVRYLECSAALRCRVDTARSAHRQARRLHSCPTDRSVAQRVDSGAAAVQQGPHQRGRARHEAGKSSPEPDSFRQSGASGLRWRRESMSFPRTRESPRRFHDRLPRAVTRRQYGGSDTERTNRNYAKNFAFFSQFGLQESETHTNLCLSGITPFPGST